MAAISQQEMRLVHRIHPSLLRQKVHVGLIGAGGTGSQVLSGLARLNRAMLGLGHPGGLQVTVYDPDLVSDANVGRQLFYDADIGHYKADVLVHRLNLTFGLNWTSETRLFRRSHDAEYDIVIGCVDTAKGRREIEMACQRMQSPYWLDMGILLFASFYAKCCPKLKKVWPISFACILLRPTMQISQGGHSTFPSPNPRARHSVTG